MGHKKLTPEQLAAAIKYQRRGWTHQRIAEALELHRVTVTRALGKHNQRLHDHLVKNAARVKGRQLAILEGMTEEALEGWERSKKPLRKTKTKTEGTVEKGPNGEGAIRGETAPLEIVRQKTERIGDPRFLAEVRAVLADMRRILGVEKSVPEAPFDLAQETAAAEAEAEAFKADERPDAG